LISFNSEDLKVSLPTLLSFVFLAKVEEVAFCASFPALATFLSPHFVIQLFA